MKEHISYSNTQLNAKKWTLGFFSVGRCFYKLKYFVVIVCLQNSQSFRTMSCCIESMMHSTHIFTTTSDIQQYLVGLSFLWNCQIEIPKVSERWPHCIQLPLGPHKISKKLILCYCRCVIANLHEQAMNPTLSSIPRLRPARFLSTKPTR